MQIRPNTMDVKMNMGTDITVRTHVTNTNHPLDAIKTKGMFFPLTQINRHTHTYEGACSHQRRKTTILCTVKRNKQTKSEEREKEERRAHER